MTLTQLGYVIEIAKAGSFNKAAKSLFVAQSNVSSAIRELEEEIGITIFCRTSKGVEFTEEGHTFYINIRPIWEQHQKVMQIYSAKTPAAPRLSICAHRYPFAVQAFVRLLKNLSQNNYVVRIRETSTHEIMKEVSSQQSDLGILFLSDSTEQFIRKALELWEMEFHLLKKVKPHAFLGTHHPLAKAASVDINQLCAYPFIMFDQKNSSFPNFAEEIIPLGFCPPQQIIYINDRSTAYNIMANSDAFTLGTGLLPDNFNSYGVTSIPIQGLSDEMQIGWIKLKDRALTPIAQEYILWLENYLANSQDNHRIDRK